MYSTITSNTATPTLAPTANSRRTGNQARAAGDNDGLSDGDIVRE